jgi:hypothetical protein
LALEYGIVVYDIDLEVAKSDRPQDAVNVLAMYGPYSSMSEAEDRLAYVEDATRSMFTDRFGSDRYEFKLEAMPLQITPVLGVGWL